MNHICKPSIFVSLRHAALPLSAMALAAVLGGTAMAQGTPVPTAPVSAAVASPVAAPAASAVDGPALTIRQIYDRLEAAGYRDLREIEWDHGHYEVKARDPQGRWVKLDVDGQSGAVLRSRNKR